MRSKIIVAIVLGASFMCNLFLLYNWIDRSISLSYSEQSIGVCSKDLKLTKTLLIGELKHYRKKDVIGKINENHLNDSMIDNGGELYLGEMEFIFEDGFVIDIK